MIKIEIPGYKELKLQHLVLDYNGTIARDGQLLPNIKEILNSLAEKIQIHVLTADTFGEAVSWLIGVMCEISILPEDNQDTRKSEYIKRLGPKFTVCIGNGRNDRQMLKEAALGIAVVQEEGAALGTVLAADIVCTDILSALDLLRNPLRLKATMRS